MNKGRDRKGLSTSTAIAIGMVVVFVLFLGIVVLFGLVFFVGAPAPG